MAKSMTAYGRASGEVNGKIITVELKSVNSRYFDPQTKIYRTYAPIEDRIKARVQNSISRGKVDICLNVEIRAKGDCQIQVDFAYAESYISALRELRDRFQLKDDLSLMHIAQNRDVFTFTTPDEGVEEMWDEVLPILDQALLAFDKMRTAEGERLKADLMVKKEKILALTQQIYKLSQDCVETYHDKFEARLKRIIKDSGVEIDQQRILTECAIYADKVAVDEELVRLESHFKTFDEIFSSTDPVGRKLDFLVQEMNRESNTIGSKCTDSSIAKLVIEIKSEIEKIREQIQNLE